MRSSYRAGRLYQQAVDARALRPTDPRRNAPGGRAYPGPHGESWDEQAGQTHPRGEEGGAGRQAAEPPRYLASCASGVHAHAPERLPVHSVPRDLRRRRRRRRLRDQLFRHRLTVVWHSRRGRGRPARRHVHLQPSGPEVHVQPEPRGRAVRPYGFCRTKSAATGARRPRSLAPRSWTPFTG